MAKFPALPASVDRYVREFLNRLAGRSGNAGDKAVLHSELAELGLAEEIGQRLSLPASAVGAITDTLKPVQPEITVPVDGGDGEVIAPDAPTAATGLSTNGIFGAVILQWDAPAYNGHNHTEVWRAQIDDREQASLVHEASGSRYTDVTGNTVQHYYWVRHVNSGGQVGGFNALAGTAGQGTAIINLADLILESPELSEQPFSVRNIGTEQAPQYVLIFNGYLAVNGPVNISQLKSGELQDGTALTVGRGSIELSTGTDGFGQMVITGSGGIANNDYLLLKEGRIESFIYSETAGHIRYKEVRRTESGVATNGQEVVIPAYFKAMPTVNLYPRDITVYNADYPDQSQRLEMDHSVPQPHPSIEGAWVFTPYARLLLADGTKTDGSGKTYLGSSNSRWWAVYNTDQVKKVTVNCRVASHRSTGESTGYQNRKATLTLEYRPDGSDWITSESTSVDINEFETHVLQVSKTLTQANYDIAVSLTTEDREGTFTSGSIDYEYDQRGKLGTALDVTLSPEWYAESATYDITINNHELSGWEITRIEYTATVDINIVVKNLFYSATTGGLIKGRVRVKLPDGALAVIKPMKKPPITTRFSRMETLTNG
ncbi:hypothetical protein [Endozoicomonas sp. YOMI1]|uniref:hypothetical protein n=1 Tax=Endozoicomonas sp. YOMI1 TaxID=2828739 RepID=UPI00214847C9|nr:hypothetical protein [Endozoicomonas sp. YOMI1]